MTCLAGSSPARLRRDALLRCDDCFDGGQVELDERRLHADLDGMPQVVHVKRDMASRERTGKEQRVEHLPAADRPDERRVVHGHEGGFRAPRACVSRRCTTRSARSGTLDSAAVTGWMGVVAVTSTPFGARNGSARAASPGSKAITRSAVPCARSGANTSSPPSPMRTWLRPRSRRAAPCRWSRPCAPAALWRCAPPAAMSLEARTVPWPPTPANSTSSMGASFRPRPVRGRGSIRRRDRSSGSILGCEHILGCGGRHNSAGVRSRAVTASRFRRGGDCPERAHLQRTDGTRCTGWLRRTPGHANRSSDRARPCRSRCRGTLSR